MPLQAGLTMNLAMKYLYLVLLMGAICSCVKDTKTVAPTTTNLKDINFNLRTKQLKTLSTTEILANLAQKELTMFEFHEKANATYKGVSLKDLLVKIYGDEWTKFDKVKFTCTDGYQASVKVSDIKKLNPLLATSRTDKAEFSIIDKTAKKERVLNVSPAYLVWDNIKNPEWNKVPKYAYYPWGIKTIDLMMDSDAK